MTTHPVHYLTCAQCGYDLKGLPAEGACPECGHSIRESELSTHRLTKRELAEIVCRCIALLFMAFGVPTLVAYIVSVSIRVTQSAAMADEFPWIIYTLTYSGAYVAVSVLLWWKAAAIARQMVSQNGIAAMRGNVDAEALLRVVAIGIGIYLCITGFAPCLGNLISYALFFESMDYYRPVQSEAGGIAGQAIRLILGLLLMFGSRWLAGVAFGDRPTRSN